jgi:hypothetical protein
MLLAELFSKLLELAEDADGVFWSQFDDDEE